jgi:hypothetical protein
MHMPHDARLLYSQSVRRELEPVLFGDTPHERPVA